MKLLTKPFKVSLASLMVFSLSIFPYGLMGSAYAEIGADQTADPGAEVIIGDTSDVPSDVGIVADREISVDKGAEMVVPGPADDISGKVIVANSVPGYSDLVADSAQPAVVPQAPSNLAPLSGSFAVSNETELIDAIAAASASGEAATIVLEDDIETSQTILIPTGADITLIGDHGLNMMQNGSVLGINEGASLTLDGIHVSHNPDSLGLGIEVAGLCHFVSGSISGNQTTQNGGGVYVYSGGIFNMDGGGITGNTANYNNGSYAYGGGVYNLGIFNMTGGTISENTAVQGGGVVVFSGASFTMSGGSISSNSASAGGGIALYAGTFDMSGGSIRNNEAEGAEHSSGGGIYNGGGIVNISGGNISNNSAVLNGGGICNDVVLSFNQEETDASLINMTGGEISANESLNGGGIWNGGDLFINGGLISGNNADLGGGVFSNTPTTDEFSMLNGTISGNVANTAGGGIYNLADFTMQGGEITDNKALANDGGGVWNYYSFTMSGGEISGNDCAGSGGGVSISMVLPQSPFRLGGSAVVTGNTQGGATADNVELIEGAYVTLGDGSNGADAPGASMSVGVTKAADGGVFVASGADEGDVQYFRADGPGLRVAYDSGQLMLVEAVPPVITTSIGSTAWMGTTWDIPLEATGDAPITWDIASGALPDGLSLSPDGVISGIALRSGVFNFTIRATNSAGSDTEACYMYFFDDVTYYIITTPSPLGDATVGAAYTQALETDYRGSAVLWSVTSGTLPDGLTLSSPEGVISGTPTEAGTFTFSVSMLRVGGSLGKTFTLTVGKAALGGTVAVSGTPSFGETLTAVTGLTSDPAIADLGEVSYQWQRGGTDVPGATSESYTLTEADVGQAITVVVTASGCSGEVVSAPTAAVAKAEGPAAPALDFAIGEGGFPKTITVTPAPGAEYRFVSDGTDTGYTAGNTFIATSPGEVAIYVRFAETATHEASEASSTTVDLAKESQAAPAAFALQYDSTDGATYTVTIQATPGAEYSFDGTTWGAGNTLSGCQPGQSVTGYKRMAETAVANASGAVSASATLPLFQVATPTASPDGGAFTGSQAVALSCATPGAMVYYTLDGTDPTAASTPYTAPFTLSSSATVKAVAVKAGMADSSLLTAVFDIAVQRPALGGTVAVSGTPRFGETLTAVTGLTSDPAIADLGEVSYQWQRDGADIPGATGEAYTLTEADIGQEITVVVAASECAGTVASAPTAAVAKADQAAPAAFALQYASTDGATYTVTIPATPGAEYSFDGTTWDTSNTLSGCQPGQEVTGYKRMAETAAANASGAVSASVALPLFDGPVAPVHYTVTKDFGTWTGTGTAQARIDAPFDKFVGLTSGGAVIDPGSYAVTEGSTVITLSEGYLKTLADGAYPYTAEFTDGSAALTLTVDVGEGAIVHAAGVTLDRTAAAMAVGDALQLIATVSPADATYKDVAWSSSDPSVATVDATGRVSALKAGTATITASTEDGGYTAMCAVTVTEAATASQPQAESPAAQPSDTGSAAATPQTGDASPLAPWAALGAASLAALVCAAIGRRRRAKA